MSRRAILLRFGSVFLASLFVETIIWFSVFSFTDIFLWEPGVALIRNGAIPDLWGVLPVHPGATFLYGSALISLFNIPEVTAMRTFMVLALSILITLISYLCYTLRPKSYWWLLVVVVLAPYVAMLDMTPPSTLAAVLSALYVLLVLKISEENGANARTLSLAGLCAGILLATRIDAGALLLLVSIPYLWLLARNRAFITIIFAMLFFLALNPFFWVNPIEHFASALYQAYTNHLSVLGYMYSRHSLILPALSVLLAIGYTFLRPQKTTLSHGFLLWLLGASCIMCGTLLLSPYHPVRYFFPLMTIWEVFLPLFVLELIHTYEHYLRRLRVSGEFVIFLWLFLDRFPPALYLMLQKLAPHGLHL